MGEKKSINFPHPHWKWPYDYNEELIELKKFMKKMVYSKKGFPKVVESFEDEFSKYNNLKYTLTTNSCTSALHRLILL